MSMAAVETDVPYEALQVMKKFKIEVNGARAGSLLVKKLSPHATIPTRGSSLAAGYDLYR